MTKNTKNSGNRKQQPKKTHNEFSVVAKKPFVVLPGHNEAKNLGPVLEKVLSYTPNVIFVDDGSTDSTYAIASNSGAIVLRHITNLGKGAALRTGCDYALLLGAERIVVMDSDGQHNPKEIGSFVGELEAGSDVVVGCRKFNKNMPFMMKIGNQGLYKISSVLFGIDVPDTQSGYRAFTADAYRKIRWAASDYSMESEMLARIHSAKLECTTVPIETIYLDNYKGTTALHGLRILLDMILWRILGLSDNSMPE